MSAAATAPASRAMRAGPPRPGGRGTPGAAGGAPADDRQGDEGGGDGDPPATRDGPPVDTARVGMIDDLETRRDSSHQWCQEEGDERRGDERSDEDRQGFRDVGAEPHARARPGTGNRAT